jgi:hypothetical protein
MRVSELKLKAKGKAPRTWLDEYDKTISAITEKPTKQLIFNSRK